MPSQDGALAVRPHPARKQVRTRPGAAVLLIESGLIALRRGDRGRQRIAMLLGDGDILGDVPLITGSPAAFDAVMVDDADVADLLGVQRSSVSRASDISSMLTARITEARVAVMQARRTTLTNQDRRPV